MPHSTNTVFQFAAAIAVILTLSSPSLAQQPPASIVRGEILGVEGKTITIKTRDDRNVAVELTDKTAIVGLRKISLTDIKPNAFVGVASVPEASGAQTAVSVHLFPEAARGTGEGDRPFDYRPKSTMTNGTVNSVAGSAAGATVDKAEGKTLTLNFKEGEKKIDVTPETPIVTYAPATKDELKPGAAIYITAATKEADGTLSAGRINVGRGIVPPM